MTFAQGTIKVGLKNGIPNFYLLYPNAFPSMLLANEANVHSWVWILGVGFLFSFPNMV